MQVRIANVRDFPAMHRLRMSVRENKLRNPTYVTVEDYQKIIDAGGRAWVCEEGALLLGFAVADLEHSSIWALFVDPDHERRGVGRALHDAMMNWLFSAGLERVSLTTEPGTRAQRFYEAAGWRFRGLRTNGEASYELSRERWLQASMRGNEARDDQKKSSPPKRSS